MNLVRGKIVGEDECGDIVSRLPELITATMSGGGLSVRTVIDACDRLSKELDISAYIPLLESIGIGMDIEARLDEARIIFSREYLEARVAHEMGGDYLNGEEKRYVPVGYDREVREITTPLGTLLHIAAGNVDALPAYTVAEGLLTGNINILKLPSEVGGVSAILLQKLIEIEPALTEYIYVFDYSSSDVEAMADLLSVSDAVVVWGGDETVRAVRRLSPPNTKIIEWGHKISFAYMTGEGATDEALAGVAANACETNGLYCSSCQGIFLDTQDFGEVKKLARRLLEVMDGHAAVYAERDIIGEIGQSTIKTMTEELELKLRGGGEMFRGKYSGVTAYSDSRLAPSLQFRNLWVRPLPREKFLTTIKLHKNHLQTVGLQCAEHERAELLELLARSGVVRITDAARMSRDYCGIAHDGEFALRRYTKTVSVF